MQAPNYIICFDEAAAEFVCRNRRANGQRGENEYPNVVARDPHPSSFRAKVARILRTASDFERQALQRQLDEAEEKFCTRFGLVA